MERFFKRKLSTDSSSLSNPGSSNARPIEVDEILANLQADSGLRTRMADYSPNIGDEIRRAYLQKGPCQPRSYKFPQTNQSGINRRFIAHWFDDHDWLEYSIAKDASFCLHCYLFKSNFDQVGGDAFTGVGFNNWKKAKERFNLHIGPVGSVHNQAREVAYNLMHQTTHIETIVIKQTSQARTAYRTCLNASLKCTRYLLRQGLSFRGHDESAQSSNKGNYLELLQFLADHDEKVKAVVLENAPGNLKLIAPSIQKDLVNSCAKETIDLILSDVKDRYFSIMVDEARDVSIKEQMAMVLRYVNDKGQIIERFVGVQHVTDTTSSALKEAIDEFFSSANLSFSKLRGQGYDGASNMRALVAVAKKNIDVNSFFTTANSLVNVVGASCKRRDALRAQYQEELVRAFEDDCLITGRGLNQERTLKRAGDTRWNSHYGTLISIISMFPSVVNVLQMIVDDNPNDSSGEAYKLWREIQSFEFVFHLFVMKAILGITNILSLALQKKDQDIVSAMNLVKTCKENLQLMRDNEFEELVEQASSFCYKHDIIVPTMDEENVIPGRSRRNAPMKTNYHRYRVEIFIHGNSSSIIRNGRPMSSSPSPTWRAIEHGVDILKNGVKIRVGNKLHTLFWTDYWFGDGPLIQSVEGVDEGKLQLKVAYYLAHGTWDLHKLKEDLPLEMVGHIICVPAGLCCKPDSPIWKHTSSGSFSVNLLTKLTVGTFPIWISSSGTWVKGFAANIGYGQVLDVELWGIYYGLNSAWDMGCNDVVLESDSAVVMHLLNKAVDALHPLATFL
ncbi:hypothetical protein L3X38_011248 [Prunus dulcis]|uniref:TTF-type domain-containing protein n=2 Tax=Prunus dulcis TaxID=3755 RepID=A0AAD4ZE43_PRUDU|nr:hypothetical protein L3X38_011248 [Prunus dulcis]